MRILMYADRPASLGGIETHISTLSLALAESGCDVTVAFARIDDPGIFAAIQRQGIRVVAASPDRVLEMIHSGCVDLIHAHSYGASRLAFRARRQSPIPAAITIHGPGQELPGSPTSGVRVICVSHELAAPLQRACGERLCVVENGVDLHRFARDSAGTEEAGNGRESQRRGALQAVYLGRVGPSKRPGLVTLQQALGSRSDVDLSYVSNWSPDGRARPSHNVETSLQKADLVFSTGRGIREAMASGAVACVLGVYWDGLVTPESVEALRWSNFSGRTHRERPTPLAVSPTVRELIGAPARLAELKEFSWTYARQHFSSTCATKRILALYRELLSEAD